MERRIADAFDQENHRVGTGIVHLWGGSAVRCKFITPGTNGAWIHDAVRLADPRRRVPVMLCMGDPVGGGAKVACRLGDFELAQSTALAAYLGSRSSVRWKETRRTPEYLDAWLDIEGAARTMLAIQVDGSTTIVLIFDAEEWCDAST